MRYIRAKSGKILKQADTIEELCDGFITIGKDDFKLIWNKYEYDECFKGNVFPKDDILIELYGAIWTDKGLIYVAKMNEKGELELL